MKVLGRIGGNEIVLDRDDGSSALKLVSSLPDPSGNDRTVQLEINVGEYKAGDIFVSDGSTWTKVEPPTETVGAVTGLVYPRVGCDVQIRWRDPKDNDPYVWKCTRVLRKYGSYPTSIHDGVIVTESHVKDQYKNKAYHDLLPAGTEGGWFYRMYTCSEDDVWFSSDDCIFTPIELSWQTLTDIVRAGNAGLVFALGDVVTVNYGSSDKIYKNLQFEVVRFNGVSPEDLNLTHSITFALVNAIGEPVHWDEPWAEYQLTADTYVASRTKQYYIKDGEEFVLLTNLRLGSRIPPNTYYERSDNQERQLNGGNRWAKSMLRSWMNSTDPDNLLPCEYYVVTEDTVFQAGKKYYYIDADGKYAVIPNTDPYQDGDGNTHYRNVSDITSVNGVPVTSVYERPVSIPPPLTKLDAEVVAVISNVRNRTALPTVDGDGSEITIDAIYPLSQTEVVNINPYREWYTQTHDTTPKESIELTKDETRDPDKTYLIYNGTKFVECTAADFDVYGQFVAGVNYYEAVPKKYYLLVDESYVEATEDDFGDGHSFLSDHVYYDQNILNVTENEHCPQFSDEELTSKIKMNQDEEPCSWWLRSADIFTSSNVKAIDENGELINGGGSSSEAHNLVFAFTVA